MIPGRGYDAGALRGDIFGGLTSAVVALPVALAFGIASGLGPATGLYSVIAVGFFASVFGGTRSQISGPTAPMTVAMAVIVTTHASTLGEAFAIVVLAGLLQVALGLLRIGRFVVYTPHVVVSGFMSGIGVIIMLIQSLPFIGAPAPSGGARGAIDALAVAVHSVNYQALAIATVTLLIAVLWPRRFSRYAPPALVALVTGTLMGVLWLTGVPAIGEIPRGLPDMQVTLPSAGFLLGAAQPALVLALLGSVDSLLTSLVADSLTGQRHDPNRELVGQGIGNVVSGVFGGLPGAGATMGTVTNIRAGGTTRVSGVLRAVIVLGLLLGLGPYVEPIPHAVLAGILMKVGWDIIDWRLLTRIHRIRRAHLVVMLVTLGLTVFVDLVTAVAIGLIVAAMAHAQEMEVLELDSVISVPLLDRAFFAENPEMLAFEDEYAARTGLVALKGSFTVASAHKLVGVIGGDISEHEIVIFDFSGATFLDDSAAMLIAQLFEVAQTSRTEVIVMGLTGSVAETLRSLDILRSVPDHHVVDTLDQARNVAINLLAS
ncbi:MAG: SulP family inorganic anion transporter [Gemmatimonadota bacterium]|nr:SulP family inorganic anion transporter [Gemmatimonadota bacterium]MDE2864727.1 SulP family inorganic anion transporter [Gemmatimonadota bacterium]MYB08303.1 SulP family inorganic anion transporter [Gemmatimonadota bacterium]MYE16674.1 SulP family inorganic anion transporter [Gemmatimonadota bacterium]MYG24359.1 SulP family inorganic anion transporter [Gemmatimonadota bacterium]